jgi:hypothetical protein
VAQEVRRVRRGAEGKEFSVDSCETPSCDRNHPRNRQSEYRDLGVASFNILWTTYSNPLSVLRRAHRSGITSGPEPPRFTARLANGNSLYSDSSHSQRFPMATRTASAIRSQLNCCSRAFHLNESLFCWDVKASESPSATMRRGHVRGRSKSRSIYKRLGERRSRCIAPSTGYAAGTRENGASQLIHLQQLRMAGRLDSNQHRPH